jgi:uncharacterized membrane protein
MKIFAWIIFSFLSVVVAAYPFFYFVFDMSAGFPSLKSEELRQSIWWNAAFYLHIGLGGIALLTGFSQFSKKLRTWNLKFHRLLGKIYVVSVLISSVAGLYIAMFATGGIISVLGFSGLAIVWFYFTLNAYLLIHKGEVTKHQHMMIRSYALCWGAVTLRLWAPFLEFGLGLEFMTAYRIISWIVWLNLGVAEIIIWRMTQNKAQNAGPVRVSSTS